MIKPAPPTLTEVAAAYREAVSNLGPQERLERKARIKAARDAAAAKRAERKSRSHNVLKRFLAGHSRPDIAKSLGIDPETVRRIISEHWPLPHVDDRRTIAISIPKTLLIGLDRLCKDHLLASRAGAMEELAALLLSDDAKIAREIMSQAQKRNSQ